MTTLQELVLAQLRGEEPATANPNLLRQGARGRAPVAGRERPLADILGGFGEGFNEDFESPDATRTVGVMDPTNTALRQQSREVGRALSPAAWLPTPPGAGTKLAAVLGTALRTGKAERVPARTGAVADRLRQVQLYELETAERSGTLTPEQAQLLRRLRSPESVETPAPPPPQTSPGLNTEPGSSQGLLPGVEPRTRQQLLQEARDREADAQRRMSFTDENLGIQYEPRPGGWQASHAETTQPMWQADFGEPRRAAPVVDTVRAGLRPVPSTARAAGSSTEGVRYIPDPSEPAPEHLRLRRSVGHETEQRMLEKDAQLQAAQEAREAAQLEHSRPMAFEERAATTRQLQRLREAAAQEADPARRVELEREIYHTLRQKPLIGDASLEVWRAEQPQRPGGHENIRYTNPLDEYSTPPPELTGRRHADLNAQQRAVVDALRQQEQLGSFVEDYVPSHRTQGQLPDWVYRMNQQGTTRQPAGEDWWRQTTQADPKRFPELQPPPDPHTMNRNAVNAFLKGAQENPGAIFQYGPSPEATSLEGIAQAMGRHGGKSEPIDFEWSGRGEGPRERSNGTLTMRSGGGEIEVRFRDGLGHVDATQAPSDGGALMYQVLNDHATKHGYKIDDNSLYAVNKLRVNSNVLANIARTGHNPRDVSSTSSGAAPRPQGFAKGPEVWRAEAGSARARVETGAPEGRAPQGNIKGGDPEAVTFDPDRGFSIHGEHAPEPEQAIRARIKELSPGLLVADKPGSTGVGAKTLMRRAVFDWVRNAGPKKAREVAANWGKWGPLFGAAGISIETLMRAAQGEDETN